VAVAEPPAEPEEPVDPLLEASPAVAMMAEVDPADGQGIARRCVACHTFEEGQPHRAGPNLWDKVNAPIAAREGFRYSAALQEFAQEHGEWDLMTLDAFLEDPRGTVPGTTMVFPGVPRVEERAALLAYMRSLSDDPVPLPIPGGEDQPQQ
jgi:cytochrome c